MKSAEYLIKKVIKAKDKGEVIPLMGICLGYEMIIKGI